MKKLVGKFCSIVKEIDNSPILVGWIEELREENEKLKQRIKELEVKYPNAVKCYFEDIEGVFISNKVLFPILEKE